MKDRLRRLGAHPRVEPATALVLRARQVRETAQFIRRELSGAGEHVYRLRESGLRVVVRHGTGDVVTLGEIFHHPDYEPPPGVVPAPRRIVDLGANVGMFGLWALGRWPEAEVTGYEADPQNAAVHVRAIAANDLADRWLVIVAAAGAAAGKAQFASGQIALSHVTDDGDLEVEVRDVLPHLAEADLVKMDIEGGEWAILGDERFAAAPPAAIVLEYHPRSCPRPDPHAEVRRLLEAAGMQTTTAWMRPDGHGLIWGVR